MPSESLSNSESTGKRKVKNKAQKRLRRKNKPVDINTEENVTNNIPPTENESLMREKNISENIPRMLSISSSTIDINPINTCTDETSIEYWRSCTKKAIDILEKQATNRRKLLIEKHQERVDSIQCLLYQRQQIQILSEKYHLISQSHDSLRNELRTKDETLKIFEDRLHDRDELLRHNEFLRVQLRLIEQKFERITNEYSKKVEETHQYEQESREEIHSLMDEIERIKRDLVLEEYRKQEAERKVRCYDEKLKIEQNSNKKMHQDIIQLKQELKSIHMRYDSLQIEMLAMHKANNNDIALIPTKDTNENEWPKKRTINRQIDEQLESKRSKRKTRDRTESSASRTSSCSEQRNEITTKLSKNKENDGENPSLTRKRKTIKSKQTNKNAFPIVTVTHASPSIDPPIIAEKDAEQLLLLSTVSATSDGNTPSSDSHDTSSESQILIQPRIKKPSRYPCRRAQRPVKQTDINNPV
ncbi:hypothetical protein I4U23_009072 [Adineta vaga]|nr:hypothetical protein I4U23_009072 [Adineta vaga]